jgi:hypothetical protein
MQSNLLKTVLRAAAYAGAGLLLTASVSSAADVDVYLQAQSFDKSLAGDTVPMWGFAECDSTFTTCDSPEAPGPQINVATGDNLTIHLKNTLATPVSIVIPGQAGGGDPVWFTDTQGRQRVRSFTAETAAGLTETYTWSSLRSGTFLYQSGTYQSIQAPMGLYGALVVAPTAPAAGCATAFSAYDDAKSCYDADAVLLFSEIDPWQNVRVAAAAAAAMTMSTDCVSIYDYDFGTGTPVGYPCTVDYSPKYFLINGAPYDPALPQPQLAVGDGLAATNVLLRYLNAGLRSHAPAIVGRDMGLIAEDGSPYPGLARQQSDALLPAGKTLDAIVAMPAGDVTYPLFDRFLNLTNDNWSPGGNLVYLVVGAGSTPATPTIYAVDDSYNVMEDTAYNAASVLGNDVGLVGADVSVVVQASNGVVVMNGDGSFTYTPNLNFSGTDSFSYSADLAGTSYGAQVTLDVSFANDAPVAAADGPYTNTIGPNITADAAHGVLGNDADPDGDPLTAVLDAAVAGLTLNPDGSFTYTGASTTFSYHASDGAASSASQIVALDINPVSNIALTVKEPDDPDGTPGAFVTDYRWIVQEDATFPNDPDNPAPTDATLSTTFHKSYMPVVAQGSGASEFSQLALDSAKRYYVSVLPKDWYLDQTETIYPAHALGGAQILPGMTSVTVVVNDEPIPTAQLSVIVFEDNAPTNGVPDAGEPGLGGWQISLEDAGGRYGISGGLMSQDAYGEPLKNSLLGTAGCPGAAPTGVILTCPDGTALIKDIAPAKIGVFVTPPGGGATWTQTSTIEGTKLQDNWLKAGEPPFLVEFGAPGYHAFIGFVNPANTIVDPSIPPGQRNNTITGKVTMLHPERAPSVVAWDSGSYDGLSHTRAWVGLNSAAGDGPNIMTVQADGDGNFTMEGIPDGTYQLAIWDDYLDQIISYQTVTLPGGENVGNIPVPTWFGRHEHNVFLDDGCAGTGGGGVAGDGIRQDCELGLSDQNVNLRFRDGTVEQSFPTDTVGFVPFDQVFPYGAWQVAEIDYLRYEPTGVTVSVDGGGNVDPAQGSTTPYPGLSNPQTGSPRSETGPVLLEGFQSMPSMTSFFDWGKAPWTSGKNGGIAGIVYYASTRGENDPRLTAGDPWEPGIPHVKVRLMREVAREDGSTGLALVREVETDSWDDNLPDGCEGEATADNPFVDITLNGDRTRCFDGIRNWEQVRPGAVFDGGYAFGPDLACDPDDELCLASTHEIDGAYYLNPGAYVVEVVLPPGYELYKEQDKNVDFGDTFFTKAAIAEPPVAQPGIAQPPCVGALHTLPSELSLFPGVAISDNLYDYDPGTGGVQRPLCDRKRVMLSDQSQAAADFHLFTSTPVAGQFYGLTTDDIAVESDPRSPNAGDKWSPPYMPITQRDFMGREIYYTHTDAFGRYNGLVASTFNANLPVPSGYSPAMYSVCLNEPFRSDGSPDPAHNPAYGDFCYTLMYMPGTTTYLDTPLLPLAAFAAGFSPVDCDQPDNAPVIASVDGTGVGPLVAEGGTLTIHSQGTVAVPNPAYLGPLEAEPSTIDRNYGFGATPGTVTLDGVALDVAAGDWTDAQITATVVPTVSPGPHQLVVTNANGLSTVNAVTVTVGNETPIRVSEGESIQDAIDAASNGDLILVGPGMYNELVVMWKPVRLQGSGASTIINAAKLPPEKLEAWLLKVQDLVDTGAVDLLPGQPAQFDLVGPGLLGTELGAGVTVLAKNDGSFAANNPRIDGFTITDADGGGGIFVNGYAHKLEISNNNITGNSGVLHGGMRVGHPALPLEGDGPFGFNSQLSIHNNSITRNGGQADTAIAGGLAMCAGSDNYVIRDNFICGNFNLGDGGGIGHLGLSTPGTIASNRILWNQVFNQGQNSNGGGIFVGGEANPAGALTLGAGNVTIDANLIQGNHAGSGHGGGIRTQSVNGRDVELGSNQPNNWWSVRMTNNMIVNNVAGWSGGGISLQDTVNSSIILNTVANNDSTATVGAVFDAATNTTAAQPAGISSERNSLDLDAVIPGNASSRRNFSNPELTHNIVWHNRAFSYDGSTGVPHLVPELAPTAVGECAAGAAYWDLGVLDPGFKLSPARSILTSTAGYAGNNSSDDPLFLNEYCNGARTLSAPGPIQVGAEVVEGGNLFDVRYGPLTSPWPAGSDPWDYHISSTSPAIDNPGNQPSGANVDHDFDDDTRPGGSRVDWGADEYYPAGTTEPPATGMVTYDVDPNSVDFGNVPVGTTAELTITATITGATVTFGPSTGPSAPFAKTADTCSGNIVTDSCSFTVTFTPINGEPPDNAYAGSVSIPHDGDGAQGVYLSGTGVLPGVVEIASASFGNLGGGTLAFGNLSNGNYSSTVTLTVGEAAPVTFGTLAVNGSNRFTKTADNCSGATVSPGSNCTFTITFNANGNSARTGTVTFPHNGSGPQSLALTGQ